jgi:hypothetical protein
MTRDRMHRLRKRASLALGCALLPAAARAFAIPDASAIYSVTMIHATYTAGASVGVRKAGLLCLPNGAIQWRDLAARDERWVLQLIDDALAQNGLSIDRSGGVRPSVVGIRGEIKRIGFRLCARRWALGDGSMLDGDGALQIEWRVVENGGSPRLHSSTVGHHIDRAHPVTAADLYEMLLTDAGTDLAHWLKMGDAASAPASPAAAIR